MIEYAYYNGVFTPYKSAVIPLSDRSIFFSDAIYDVMVGRGKTVYQIEAHLDRLFRSAAMIGIRNLPDISELYNAIDELVNLFSGDEFMLYVQFSTDAEKRTHTREDDSVNVLMTVTACELPTDLQETKAITLPDMRHRFCNVKTTSLLPAVLSVEEAKRRESDIAIFHKDNVVTEGSYANIAIIKNGVLITHPFDADILPGITQVNLEGIAQGIGILHERRPFTVEELYQADAVLITSTTKLIRLCTEIDGRAISVKVRDTVEQIFSSLKDDLYSKTE